MLIGHVRWIGLLANVWCSNLSEFSDKKYATRSFTIRAIEVRNAMRGGGYTDQPRVVLRRSILWDNFVSVIYEGVMADAI